MMGECNEELSDNVFYRLIDDDPAELIIIMEMKQQMLLKIVSFLVAN